MYLFKFKSVFLSGTLLLLLGAGTAFAQTAVRSVKGTIQSMTKSELTLKRADGSSINIWFSDKTHVFQRGKAELSEIKPGDALGVTSVLSKDGTMTAKAITIFPSGLLKRIRNGQFPMGNSGNIMTNAEVLRYALGVSGHTLKMKLAKGVSDIQVPDGTPIVRLKIMKTADLRVSSHVTVRGRRNPDGSMTATSIAII